MSSPFIESWNRIERAALHREAFIKTWNALIEKDRYRLGINLNADGTGIIQIIRLVDSGDADIALELGELFYQLRAALDGLVFKGILMKKGLPIPNENRLAFPIRQTEAEFKRDARNIEPLPDQLRLWIERIQPYNASKDADPAIAAIGGLLNILNDCARKDRHRHLHVVAAHGSEVSGTILFDPPVKLISLEGITCNLLNHVSELAVFRISEYVPHLQVHLTGKLHVEVSVAEIPGFYGERFMEILHSIGRATELAVREFEVAFQ